MLFPDTLIAIRGGGDLGTGVTIRLVRSGFPVVVLELAQPLSVRRKVCISTAVHDGQTTVEGVSAQLVPSAAACSPLLKNGSVPVLIDPEAGSLSELPVRVLVDARMQKSGSDTHRRRAPLVIGLGPGFCAGVDCHAAVETCRGHKLGRVYWQGSTERDTGVPDTILGQNAQRVLRAPCEGKVRARAEIGDPVAAGQVVAVIGDQQVRAAFDGILRGLIADGTHVPAGVKIGDVDPRKRREFCFAVSDKSLAIGGGVLEAVLTHLNATCPRQPAVSP